MKKLDVEELDVESFSPESSQALVASFTPLGGCTGCDSTCGINPQLYTEACY